MANNRKTSNRDNKRISDSYSRYLSLKSNPKYRKKPGSDNFFEFSEWAMRRVAPIAMVIYAFTILFIVTWFIGKIDLRVGYFGISPSENQLGVIDIPEDNGIYTFELTQNFPRHSAPLYSELEIEVLNEDYDHAYSVYKDLWQEIHPNDRGTSSIYRDLKIYFELNIKKAGKYYLRGISYNNNDAQISGFVAQKNNW